MQKELTSFDILKKDLFLLDVQQFQVFYKFIFLYNKKVTRKKGTQPEYARSFHFAKFQKGIFRAARMELKSFPLGN